MSSGATLSSSPGSRLSRAESSTYAAGNVGVPLQDAAAQLPKAFSDLNTQLIRTHEGMRRLFVRCDVVGQAVQRCIDALGGTEASHGAAAADASSSSVDTSASAAATPTPAAATTAQRQLCWSLSQYHTYLAQLLSTASVRAYDAAVCDKIVNRLTLMERGASAVQRSVADAPAACGSGAEAAAVVQGSARQLELLARTRFAAAYEGFLLYAVATLGDFCALWSTAAQRSGEAVVWSSGKEGTSPMAAALHAEQRTLCKSKKTSPAVVENRAAKNSAFSESKKRCASGSSELTAALGTALHAVEELRDAVFAYVRLLHATIHFFSNAATALVNVLAAAEIGTLDEIVADSVARIQLLDEALTHAQTSMATRRACYESMFEDGAVQPLRQLQADSKKGVRLDLLVEAVNYPLMEKTSTALERALRRLTEPRRDKFASRRASRSSSDVSIPSSPLEVLFGAWCKTTELCVQIGAEVSEEFTQRVCV